MDRKGKFNLKAARAEGALLLQLEKTLCWLGFIPVLVFDCVALQYIEGISSLVSRARPFGKGLRAVLCVEIA